MRYRLSVPSSAFSANPRGSKKPIGGKAPGMLSMLKALLETGSGAADGSVRPKENASTAVDVRPVVAGAKAAVEPARSAAMARYMVIVLCLLFAKCDNFVRCYFVAGIWFE